MRTQRGGVLLIALAVLTGLVSVLALFVAGQRTAFQGIQNRLDGLRAEEMARAGIERGLLELSNRTAGSPTTLQDDWAALGEVGEQLHIVHEGSFRVQIVDACSRINLNTATQDQLSNLPLTTEQVESLLDWREPETAPRPEGAKDEYYGTLPKPYLTALRPIRSLDELLMVRGFDAATLYEPPTEAVQNTATAGVRQEDQPPLVEMVTVDSLAANVAPDGQTKLNVNTAQVQQMVQRGVPALWAAAIVQRRNQQGTFTSMSQVFQVPGANLQAATAVLDNLMAGAETASNGKINLNTASEAVLATIPNMPPDFAQAIVSLQASGIQSLGELGTLPGATLPLLGQLADLATVVSNSFLIRVEGRFGSTTRFYEAVVQFEQDSPRLIKLLRPPFSDMAVRWGWPDEPYTEIELVQ